MFVCILSLVGVVALAAGLVYFRKSHSSKSLPPAQLEKIGIMKLPSEATNIHWWEQSLMVAWVYVRFDLPEDEAEIFFSNNAALPRISGFNEDQELLGYIQACGKELPWWGPARLPDVRCASKGAIWQKDAGNWEGAFEVCIGRPAEDTVRLYVLYHEERVSASKPGWDSGGCCQLTLSSTRNKKLIRG
jgi:hypothetical protein